MFYDIARKKGNEGSDYSASLRNADGSEKLELMFIGTALRPRAFKKKYGHELGLDYYANKKAWMTSALFFDWLRRFERYIQRIKGRKVILLLDDCSAHGRMETIPEMDNVRVMFLPPNTTSKVQPMDAGIIAAMKMKYRRYQMERALDMSETNVRDIYKLDVLTAMRTFKEVWKEIDASTIQNCWGQTGIIPPRSTSTELQTGSGHLNEDMNALQYHVSQLGTPKRALSIEGLLNPAGEDEDVVQQITDGQLVASILEPAADLSSEEEVEDLESSVPSCAEVLGSIAVVKQFLQGEHNPDSVVMRGLRALQGRVRHKRAQESRQTRIEDFF